MRVSEHPPQPQPAPRPIKRWGQNFLTDANIARKIVALAGCHSGDVVVELGAGKGALTGLLAAAARRLIAIEIDRRLDGALLQAIAGRENVEVLHGDARTASFAAFSQAGPIKVVGNIPYYASSEIIFNVIAQRRFIRSATFMLQKELATRLSAAPDCKDYGIPTVLLGMFANVIKGFDVSPSCFQPPPRVISTVIRMDFLSESRFPLRSEACFRLVVQRLFAQRRKSVMNNLRAIFDQEVTREILLKAGIAPSTRAENLTLQDFAVLANLISDAGLPLEGTKRCRRKSGERKAERRNEDSGNAGGNTIPVHNV